MTMWLHDGQSFLLRSSLRMSFFVAIFLLRVVVVDNVVVWTNFDSQGDLVFPIAYVMH